ncbi:WxL domain-containing protein [Enterococcus sp. BWM-S5]|uniref:WxL domain-containing protein n=1 Tax=Enterococcus larvae TaxID=2794352 RepID=A0ABS4CQ25_9ENTE|nr:WxL domain-containing protein [Enterococcus larvae]MBP1047874.1 WxL domain-containing protein [Enterococcus larvae]
MKLTHKLCGAAIVAAAGVALAVPNTTKAADDSKTGTGHIEFTLGTDTSDVIPTEPGVTDGTTITNLPSVTNPGEFGIIAVTPLEFDSHNVLTATNKRDYDALAFTANPGSTTAGTEEFEVQNFVKYQDLRTQENHAYALSATMTQNFQTASGVELKGANITYKNVYTTQTGSALLDPDGVNNTGGTIDSASNNSITFIRNTGVNGIGYGQFELNFGKVGDASQEAAESVTLNIPDGSPIGSGDYNAVITWTLSETI